MHIGQKNLQKDRGCTSGIPLSMCPRGGSLGDSSRRKTRIRLGQPILKGRACSPSRMVQKDRYESQKTNADSGEAWLRCVIGWWLGGIGLTVSRTEIRALEFGVQ